MDSGAIKSAINLVTWEGGAGVKGGLRHEEGNGAMRTVTVVKVWGGAGNSGSVGDHASRDHGKEIGQVPAQLEHDDAHLSSTHTHTHTHMYTRTHAQTA